MGTQFTVALAALAVVVVVLVTVVAPRINDWLLAVATGWLIAGVAGNLTDRLLRRSRTLKATWSTSSRFEVSRSSTSPTCA